MLVPPRLWRRRKCFTAAELIATQSKGSSPVMYSTRIGGEGAGPGCTPITLFLTTNCTNNCRAGAPSPLAATEAFCSGGRHRHSLTYETTQQSTRVDVVKQTIYFRVQRLSKNEDKKEISGFSSFSLTHPWMMQLRKQEGRWRRQMSCKTYSGATTNSWEKTNNPLSGTVLGAWSLELGQGRG